MNLTKSISVSSLSTLLSCPRKFFYSHEMRWVPQAEAEALTFGKAWHGLMEFYGKQGGDYRDALAQYLDSNEIALTSLNEDAFAMLMAMALEFETFAPTLGKITETESPFSFKLPKTRWRVNGIIDAVNADGCPIEYKTTSSDITDGAFYWLRLKSNLQVITYAIATSADSVRYVVARKPRLQRKQVPLLDENGCKIVTDLNTGMRAWNANGTPRQSAGNGYKLETRTETSEEFVERLREDLTNNYSFASRVVQVSDADKMAGIEAYISAIRYVEDLRKMAQKATRIDAPYIRNCTEFNCKNCPYQGICLDVNVSPTECPTGFIVK